MTDLAIVALAAVALAAILFASGLGNGKSRP